MELGPPDAIFGLVEAHKKDPRPEKVNLSMGAYRDSSGKPWVLPTVRKVSRGGSGRGGRWWSLEQKGRIVLCKYTVSRLLHEQQES